jgi:hypothetical protein
MADYSTFAEERWVRIMCDYSADGVWHKDGAGDSADKLPLERTLIERIRRWQDWYETQLDDANFDVNAFSAEGLSIARAVKNSLPDWTVIYFDEAELARASPGAPRSVFEYEVRLDSIAT